MEIIESDILYFFIIACNELTPDLALRPSFLSATTSTNEQAGKLGMGKCKTVICEYGNYQVIHFNKSPIMVTLIANNDANTGLLIALENQFESVVQELRKIVDVNN